MGDGGGEEDLCHGGTYDEGGQEELWHVRSGDAQ